LPPVIRAAPVLGYDAVCVHDDLPGCLGFDQIVTHHTGKPDGYRRIRASTVFDTWNEMNIGLGLLPLILLTVTPAHAKEYVLPSRPFDSYVLKDVHIEPYKRPLFVFTYITNWLVIPVTKTGYAADSVHTPYTDRNQMLPKPGQTCDIAYHTSFTDGATTPFGNIRTPNKIMDSFNCKTT